MVFRTTGVWGKNGYSEEASQGALDGHIRLTRFGVRVADDEIRSLVEQFGSSCSRHVYCQSESAGEACLSEAMELFQRLNAQNRFSLAFRTQNMKTPAGRAKKIAGFVEMLKRGETIYPNGKKT